MPIFKELCGLRLICGAIDCMHMYIKKHIGAFVINYFSYNMQILQVVVDYEKWFQDIFVWLLGFMNDSKILLLFSFY
jgi:ABC-type cobalt transport system substrate-binding protein